MPQQARSQRISWLKFTATPAWQLHLRPASSPPGKLHILRAYIPTPCCSSPRAALVMASVTALPKLSRPERSRRCATGDPGGPPAPQWLCPQPHVCPAVRRPAADNLWEPRLPIRSHPVAANPWGSCSLAKQHRLVRLDWGRRSAIGSPQQKMCTATQISAACMRSYWVMTGCPNIRLKAPSTQEGTLPWV